VLLVQTALSTIQRRHFGDLAIAFPNSMCATPDACPFHGIETPSPSP